VVTAALNATSRNANNISGLVTEPAARSVNNSAKYQLDKRSDASDLGLQLFRLFIRKRYHTNSGCGLLLYDEFRPEL